MLLVLPGRAVGELVVGEADGVHGDAVAGGGGGEVSAVANHHRLHKMLVQVVYIFDDTVFEGGADVDVVNHCQMLDVFTEADTAGMGADGDAKFSGHEHDGQDLVDTTQAAAINLAKTNGLGLH